MRSLCALLAALLLATVGTTAAGAISTPNDRQWPGVYIQDQIIRAIVHIALAGAADWLVKPACRAVLDDFRDETGVLLSEKMAQLGVDEITYLGRLRFRDASFAPQCAKPVTVMFTTPGSKVVFVCGRQLERLARQDRAFLNVLVIHEVLHTLGLGENPPSSNAITVKVSQRCRR